MKDVTYEFTTDFGIKATYKDLDFCDAIIEAVDDLMRPHLPKKYQISLYWFTEIYAPGKTDREWAVFIIFDATKDARELLDPDIEPFIKLYVREIIQHLS